MERRPDFRRMKDLIRAGVVRQVVEELEPHSDRHEAVADFMRHCRSNLHRMRYDECRHRDLPVGSDFFDWWKAA